MSGFAGIVNLDGAPADRSLLARMEEFLHSRGPDGQGQWVEGSVGLVHTLFVTAEESRGERQPMSLDGSSWIVADARIDGRDDLVRELAARGRNASKTRPDAELILHAYAAWGEACVEHLLGDFSFAIWDARERKLFCARDHFGIRQFFYAQVGEKLVFSNDMDCLRLTPDLPDSLNELWIADYLILSSGQDPDRSVIEAIRRLPAAHRLSADWRGLQTKRYWSLPVDPPAVYKRSQDYVERFLELFRQSISDRIRTNAVSVIMSGGTDSTAVAAVAKKILGARGSQYRLSTHTAVYDRLIPYREGHYAELTARFLDLPWYPYEIDSRRLLGMWDQPEFRHPEPEQVSIFSHKRSDILGRPLPSRLVLTGLGGDPIFSSLRLRHCRQLLRAGRLLQLGSDLTRYLLAEGRANRLYFRVHWHQFTGRVPRRRPYPDWIHPDLEKKYDLPNRYAEGQFEAKRQLVPREVVRPEAYQALIAPLWRPVLEEYDPVNSGGLVEYGHPFFDLRLVRYCLTLPALPWASDKEILRQATKGLLPESVRLRRKAVVGTDHLIAHFQNGPKPWWENFEPVPELGRFVDLSRVEQHLREPKQFEFVVHLRPHTLNYWLKWESVFAYNIRKEEPRVHSN